METPQLRLFGSNTSPRQTSDADQMGRSTEASSSPQMPDHAAPVMPVAVRDLVPLLVDAYQSDRTWLKDFGQEQIQVSPDLYEVLLAYQQLRRAAA